MMLELLKLILSGTADDGASLSFRFSGSQIPYNAIAMGCIPDANITIDFGDGNSQVILVDNYTNIPGAVYTYAQEGEYEITIKSGSFENFTFLRFFNAGFFGNLGTALRKWKNIEEFYMSHVNFTNVPQTLSEIVGLKSLTIGLMPNFPVVATTVGDSQIIPSFVFGLTALEDLKLNLDLRCATSQDFELSNFYLLGNLSNLQVLWLDLINQLHDLPDSISQIETLHTIRLKQSVSISTDWFAKLHENCSLEELDIRSAYQTVQRIDNALTELYTRVTQNTNSAPNDLDSNDYGCIVLAGDSNAIPTGTFQAPTGFVKLVDAYGAPSTYYELTAYSMGQNVTYSGVDYESVEEGNTDNQPDTSPAFWMPITDSAWSNGSPSSVLERVFVLTHQYGITFQLNE